MNPTPDHWPATLARTDHAAAEHPLTPTTVTPGHLEPAARSEPMVWIPGPGNNFIAVPRSTIPADYLTPTTPAPLPQPNVTRVGIDPRAQVLAAGGLAAAGTGWGIGQIVSAFAGLGTAGLAALALAAVVARMSRPITAGTSAAGPASTEIHVHRGARVKARNLNIR